jgi:hypothetical protein
MAIGTGWDPKHNVLTDAIVRITGLEPFGASMVLGVLFICSIIYAIVLIFQIEAYLRNATFEDEKRWVGLLWLPVFLVTVPLFIALALLFALLQYNNARILRDWLWRGRDQ